VILIGFATLCWFVVLVVFFELVLLSCPDTCELKALRSIPTVKPVIVSTAILDIKSRFINAYVVTKVYKHNDRFVIIYAFFISSYLKLIRSYTASIVMSFICKL
jgi:hypothetical protein